MKSRLLALASLLLAGGTAFAFPSSHRSSASPVSVHLPVPTRVVHPTEVPCTYENVVVNLRLTIDEAGVPHFVRSYGYLPRDLAERLLPVVRQWRFSPMIRDGHPVSADVVLPLRLVNDDRG